MSPHLARPITSSLPNAADVSRRCQNFHHHKSSFSSPRFSQMLSAASSVSRASPFVLLSREAGWLHSGLPARVEVPSHGVYHQVRKLTPSVALIPNCSGSRNADCYSMAELLLPVDSANGLLPVDPGSVPSRRYAPACPRDTVTPSQRTQSIISNRSGQTLLIPSPCIQRRNHVSLSPMCQPHIRQQLSPRATVRRVTSVCFARI